jgi:hypothetical protein
LQIRNALGRLPLEREDPAHQEVGPVMPRLQLERGLQLRERLRHPIDAGVDRAQRETRVGKLGHLRGDDLEVAGGGLQVARLE